MQKQILQILIVLTACICISHQFQFLQKKNEIQQIQEDLIEPFNEELGKKLAALSIVAYCKQSKIEKWKCGKPCKENPGMQDITVLRDKGLKDNQAFVGFDVELDAIIISWQGTNSIRNWLEDFDAVMTKYPYCYGCKVHEGFFKAYNMLQDEFWAAFTVLRQKYPRAQIMLTGHSLGAALSTFNAADMVNNGITDFIWYNYGSPRPGNKEFAEWLMGAIEQRLYRVTHHKDPVPHALLRSLGYQHLAQEIFYIKKSAPQDEHILCDTNNGEDPNCSDRYSADLNVLDHNYYMGYSYLPLMTECGI